MIDMFLGKKLKIKAKKKIKDRQISLSWNKRNFSRGDVT